MSELLNVGVNGLGVMGQRMLARLAGHARLHATYVWDADAQAVARTLAAYPQLQSAANAEALIDAPGLRCLYIATPPAPHMVSPRPLRSRLRRPIQKSRRFHGCRREGVGRLSRLATRRAIALLGQRGCAIAPECRQSRSARRGPSAHVARGRRVQRLAEWLRKATSEGLAFR